MRNISIAIVDDNRFYTKALSDYLQNEYGQAFDISSFTGTDSLREYLESGFIIDIMLIAQDLYCEALREYRVKSIMILSESSLSSDMNDMKTINKFQQADAIAKQILQSIDSTEVTALKLNKQSKTTKLICVYSASGGSGKTTVAYNLGRQYAVQGRRLLFISMEAFAALPILNTESKNHGLSYLLYVAKNKTGNMQIKLDTLIEKDLNTGIHFIPRGSSSLEYKDIGPSDTAALVEILRDQSGFDAVIFDMDSCINETALNVFKHSDIIVNVIADDNTSKGKNECFKKQLDVIGELLGISMESKLLNVNNKVMQPDDPMEDLCENGSIAKIPFIKDSSLLENGYYPELIHFKRLYDMVDNFGRPKEVQI